MKRELGDVQHHSIRYAESLWIYHSRWREFRLVDRQTYQKRKCEICPSKYFKSLDKMIECGFESKNWSLFKTHLARAERVIGELVAFPSKEDLPDLSVYKKHRPYGYTRDFQTMPETQNFYVYAPALRTFVQTNRRSIHKQFTQNYMCSYCGCGSRISNNANMINHIAISENKCSCHLIVKSLEESDKRNLERIQVLVDVYQRRQKSKLNTQPSNDQRIEIKRRGRLEIPNLIAHKPKNIVDEESQNCLNATEWTSREGELETEAILGRQLISDVEYVPTETDSNCDMNQDLHGFCPDSHRKKNDSKKNGTNNLKTSKVSNHYMNDQNPERNENSRQIDSAIQDLRKVMNNLVQLNKKHNISSELSDSLIANQLNFELIDSKKISDKDKEYQFEFSYKSQRISQQDLLPLFNRYDIGNDFEIESAEIILSLKAKNKRSIDQTDLLMSDILSDLPKQTKPNRSNTKKKKNLTNEKLTSLPNDRKRLKKANDSVESKKKPFDYKQYYLMKWREDSALFMEGGNSAFSKRKRDLIWSEPGELAYENLLYLESESSSDRQPSKKEDNPQIEPIGNEVVLYDPAIENKSIEIEVQHLDHRANSQQVDNMLNSNHNDLQALSLIYQSNNRYANKINHPMATRKVISKTTRKSRQRLGKSQNQRKNRTAIGYTFDL